MLLKKKKLSDLITHNCVITSKKFGKAFIQVRNDGPFCFTVIARGDLFDLECRGPSQFDQFFNKGWKIESDPDVIKKIVDFYARIVGLHAK